MNHPITLQQAFETALRHQQAGEFREAEAIYRQILAAHPNQADALHLLGVLAMQVKRNDVAVDLIGKAVAINPSSPDMQCNFGSALQGAKRIDEAIAAFQNAIRLRPQFPEAHFNLGNALREKKRPAEAIPEFHLALAQRPDYPEALNNLGMAFYELERIDEAIAAYEKAIALRPSFPEAYNNLGKVLHENDRNEEALVVLRKALEQDNRNALIYFNLGNSLAYDRQFDAAKEMYRRALAVDPNLPEPRFSLSGLRLLLGDYDGAWEGYEARWDVEEFQLRRRNCPQPEWDGSADVRGKRILLYSEQGFGDYIHFCRYVPLIAQRGGHVILAAQRELERLMRSLEGVAELIAWGDQTPPFDMHGVLLSMPRNFRTTVATIPASIPYLRAENQLVQVWRDRIAKVDEGKLKVGLSWAGRPTYKDDPNRTMSLRTLAPLGGLTNVQLFSLQKGAAAEQIRELSGEIRLIDWASELNDFADTAALIENLDLVIVVDTAIAHLAGAMGKAVWTLLPFAPDWRWMLNRPDSPWYPTMRLFRQSCRKDWEALIRQVVDAIQQFKINDR